MTDLTQIKTPFGLLDKATQDALREWPHGWECFCETDEGSDEYDWEEVGADALGYFPSLTYRARPAPLVPDSIDWSHVAPEWKFMARDGDGDAWLYDDTPYLDYGSWTAQNDLVNTYCFASYKRGTVAWQDSLVERPA